MFPTLISVSYQIAQVNYHPGISQSESPILIHFHKGTKIRVVWEERCKYTVERRSRKGPKIEEI